MSSDDSQTWTAEDVPPGPYLHGSRRHYAVGDYLLTDVVSNMEGEEDDRQMCFATVSEEEALAWAYRRGIRHGGDTLFVYEVEMDDPEVDTNAHGQRTWETVTSVMAPRGRVMAARRAVAVADYPYAWFG
jgi:hypothetical protein